MPSLADCIRTNAVKTLGKILGVIVLIVAFVFASQIGKIVGRSSVDSYEKGKKEGVLEGALGKIVNEVNLKTPMMVDSATRLDNAISVQDKLRYNYTLVEYTWDEISAEEIHSSLDEVINNKVCTSLKTLVGLGATIEYAYYDNKGREITVISVPPSSCAKLR